MKYYSEELKKFFNSEEECLIAETAEKTKKEVEKARLKEVHEIEQKYFEKLSAFIKDYNYYTSAVSDDAEFDIEVIC